MNSVTSAFLGFIFTAALFAICFFLVVGIKFFLLTIKTYGSTKTEIAATKPEKVKPAVKKHKTERRKLKSIEINPDEIDRIYVRK